MYTRMKRDVDKSYFYIKFNDKKNGAHDLEKNY
jgi:hypothetical protein